MKEKDLELLQLLAVNFERDTLFSSGVEVGNPYFKAIIAIGKRRPDDIIRFLMSRLDNDHMWTLALWMIVGEEKAPHIPEEHAGHVEFIRNLWLDWGRAQGYLKV